MRVVVAVVLGLCAWFPGEIFSGELPPEIVGVCATPESEFDTAFNLLGGEALYVAASGYVALGGAPLPVKRNADGQVVRPLVGLSGTSTYDASTGRLTIALRNESQSLTLVGEYRAGERTLVISMAASSVLQFSRRSPVVPIAFEKALEQAPTELAVGRTRDQ